MELDFLIRGATVYDGERIEPQRVAVGIRGEHIAHVGDDLGLSAAREVIDARGLVLCPGFIDTHASTGLGYMLPGAGHNQLYQGVTTEIIGNCGTSPGPIGPHLVETMNELASSIGFDFTWRDLDQWLEQVEAYGLSFNSGTFVGHGTLRAGFSDHHGSLTSAEAAALGGALESALEAGGLGLSTGLVYAPGSFSSTEELIEFARIVARRQGLYVSHMRNEREDLEQSVEEAIEIGTAAGLRVLISHLKAAERPNWGKIPGIIERIEEARSSGTEITFEVYPYTAVATKMRTFIPKNTLRGGVREMVARLETERWRHRTQCWLDERETDFNAMVLITESVPGARGRSVAQIAAGSGASPSAAVVDLLLADPDAWIIYHCMSADDMDAAILWPDSIICSDSWSHPVNAPNQIGDPHPRTYGAFSRFLERYALSTGRLPLGEAVRKITSLPADWLGLRRRGRVAEGHFADLVLLDPSAVKETATYEAPRQVAEGTEIVWVNGTIVLRDGEIGSARPGRILRHEKRESGGD